MGETKKNMTKAHQNLHYSSHSSDGIHSFPLYVYYYNPFIFLSSTSKSLSLAEVVTTNICVKRWLNNEKRMQGHTLEGKHKQLKEDVEGVNLWDFDLSIKSTIKHN
jgi:hypothetical protein